MKWEDIKGFVIASVLSVHVGVGLAYVLPATQIMVSRYHSSKKRNHDP